MKNLKWGKICWRGKNKGSKVLDLESNWYKPKGLLINIIFVKFALDRASKDSRNILLVKKITAPLK